MSAFRFEDFIAPNENTIILIGNKRLRAFDSIQNGYQAVLHISKDRGKSYQELTLPEQNVLWLYPSQDYSIFEAQAVLAYNSKKNSMYLLDHKSLKVAKIDEYDSEADISYYNFNGKYAVYSHNKALKLVNLLNREEEYPLPYELNNRSFWVTADDTLLILDAKQLIRYDPKNNTQTVIQQLHNDYDVLVYEDGEYFFTKFNTSKGGGTYYNSKEELLYTFEKGDRNRYYRYKNFACDYKLTSALYPIFRYSYDYGKTWFEQKFTGFFSASRPIGFYKDKFIIFHASFHDKPEPENRGGRILIGEFEK
ncbi:hypothetical protein [Gilliamella intestini]|uniref:BNR repeat-containing family member n=1 Tax=Gilliamella intestini TaxID=1798183 RepID=A0A1C4DK22_9GAMM|nr:hypothetical protein [Gilliamella intestini]SCC31595.1 hypothetical protein GA0061080_10795 [Gilliamella intestini]